MTATEGCQQSGKPVSNNNNNCRAWSWAVDHPGACTCSRTCARTRRTDPTLSPRASRLSLTSFTSALHLTWMCLRSNASCRRRTTSLPFAFLAAKPLVHVRSLPASRAVCSTGKLGVSEQKSMGGAWGVGRGHKSGPPVSVTERTECRRRSEPVTNQTHMAVTCLQSAPCALGPPEQAWTAQYPAALENTHLNVKPRCSASSADVMSEPMSVRNASTESAM